MIGKLPPIPQAALKRLYWRLDRRRYYGGIYAFEAKPPFQPLWISKAPLLRPEWDVGSGGEGSQ
jgi:hypothetical protein